MTYLAEAHNHFHAVHGWDTVCDLDCGAGEAAAQQAAFEADCERWANLAPWWWDSESYGDEYGTTVPEELVTTVTPTDWADFQAILDWEVFEGFGR